jgi:hypothetical protein
MAVEVLDILIDKQDNVELVELKIAEILVTETANQVALATTAGKTNPQLWNLKVFTERSNPWEELLNDQAVKIPIVNIWIDNSNFNGNKGDVVKRQYSETIYNIDIFAFGIASNNVAGGHNPGDQDAALEAQRAIRLVRNILMANINTYLQLQGLVGSRWPQSINLFQPQIDNRAMPNVMGARVALRVGFNELAPQQTPETLEIVSVDVKRQEDGQIVLEADYDYTV